MGFVKGKTLLHTAVWMPAPPDVSAVSSALAGKRIDLDAETDEGVTAAFVSHRNEMPLVTLQLLQLGADPDHPNGGRGTVRDAVNAEVEDHAIENASQRPCYYDDLLKVHAYLNGQN